MAQSSGRPDQEPQGGFSIHLSKPVDLDELIAIIANLAGRTA